MKNCIKCGERPVLETNKDGVRVHCKKCGAATKYYPIYVEASAEWDIMNRKDENGKVAPLPRPKRRAK